MQFLVWIYLIIDYIGYSGYLYSVKRYKGVFVASQVCENTLFIPQTMEEFQSFLYNDHVLEILCNLKVTILIFSP